MALSPEVEARVAECEAAAQEIFDELDSLSDTLDGLSDDAIVIPNGAPQDEIWDDPSMVKHVEALQATTERVRRESKELAAVVAMPRARTNNR